MKNIILLISVLSFGRSFAQKYVPDSTFNFTGQLVCPPSEISTFGNSILLQPDGKLIVAGELTIDNPNPILWVASFVSFRYNQFGQPDMSFGATGSVTTKYYPTSGDKVGTSVLQPDGKIIMGGTANTNLAMTRYLPNGTLDATFGINGKVETNIGGPDDEIRSIIILSDGSILTAGQTYLNGGFDFALAKYSATGQLDNTFGTNGIVITDINSGQSTDQCYSIIEQPDGKIVAGGQRWENATGLDFILMRYNANGSIDNSFGINGLATIDFGTIADYGYIVHYKPNGNLVITGCTTKGDGKAKFAAAEILPSGALNPSFGTNGKIIANSDQRENFFHKSVMLSNGEIYLCGMSVASFSVPGQSTSVIMKIKNNGQFDYTFNSTGFLYHNTTAGFSYFNDIVVQPDGKIVVGGTTDVTGDVRAQIVRYKPVPKAPNLTGLSELEADNFLLYPNPIHDFLQVKVKDQTGFSISIYNSLGQLVLKKDNTAFFNLSTFPCGVYAVEYSSASEPTGIVKKIVKQ